MVLIHLSLTLLCVAYSTGFENKCPQPSDDMPSPMVHLYQHPENCSQYIHCDFGKAEERECEDDLVFNSQFMTCVHRNSEYDTCSDKEVKPEVKSDGTVNCVAGDKGVYPHPAACHKYINCASDPDYHPMARQGLKPLEMECDYPDLFDVKTGSCMDYKTATCEDGAKVYKDACDYAENKCGSAHCIPCRLGSPSCVGKEDGIYGHPEKLGSPYYIYCEGERMVLQGQCHTGQVVLKLKGCVARGFVHP